MSDATRGPVVPITDGSLEHAGRLAERTLAARGRRSVVPTVRFLGVHLGQEDWRVAQVTGRHGTLTVNPAGGTATPAMIAFPPTGEPVFGQLARRSRDRLDRLTDLLGDRWRDPMNAAASRMNPWTLEEDERGCIVVLRDGRRFAAIDLAASILRSHRAPDGTPTAGPARVVLALPEPDVVDPLRAAAAARSAGMEVVAVVPDHAAAVVARGPRDGRGPTLVVELSELRTRGAIVEVSGRTPRVLAQASWEPGAKRTIDRLAERLSSSLDLHEEHDSAARFRVRAETAARAPDLWGQPSTNVEVLHIRAGTLGPVHLRATITREDLEERSSWLIMNTEHRVRGMLRELGIRTQDIDDVVLTGIHDLVPALLGTIDRMFPGKRRFSLLPQELAARGASRLAAAED